MCLEICIGTLNTMMFVLIANCNNKCLLLKLVYTFYIFPYLYFQIVILMNNYKDIYINIDTSITYTVE